MMFTVSLTDPMDTGESAPSHTRTAKDTEESTPPHTRTAKDTGESTPSRNHAGTIDPREISDLLRSRPTIRRGKPERCATVMFDRNDPVFRSVQYRRPHTTGRESGGVCHCTAVFESPQFVFRLSNFQTNNIIDAFNSSQNPIICFDKMFVAIPKQKQKFKSLHALRCVIF